MLNNIVIMGRLVRDPELRRTGSGTAVASLTLAVDRDYKSQSGEKETDFIDIVAWRSTAEFVSKYFTVLMDPIDRFFCRAGLICFECCSKCEVFGCCDMCVSFGQPDRCQKCTRYYLSPELTKEEGAF